MQFQDGAGNVKESFLVGEDAIFYIRDSDLSPPTTSVATWTEVPAEVLAGASWNLATGAPHANSYVLTEGSPYDTSTPASTPISSKPTAKVNGVTTLVATFDALTGQFTLLNDVNASSTLGGGVRLRHCRLLLGCAAPGEGIQQLRCRRRMGVRVGGGERDRLRAQPYLRALSR